MTFSLDEFLGDDGDGDGFTVDVPIKPRRLAQKHAELERLITEQMQQSSTSLAGGSEGVREMAEALQELERRIDEGTKLYRFRGLSPRRWRALKAEHPPKRRDKEAGVDFDSDTFPAAAIAACCIEPQMTLAEAKALEDDESVNSGDFEMLWQGAVAANLGVLTDTPKSVLATAILRMNGASLTTAAPGESPGASS